MTENPYAPPVADTPQTTRRLARWHGVLIVLVLFISFLPLLVTVLVYGKLSELVFLNRGSATLGVSDWLEFGMMAMFGVVMAIAGVMLVFRQAWSLHLFLLAFVLLLAATAGGVLAPKALAWVLMVAIIAYVFFLGRRSYLH